MTASVRNIVVLLAWSASQYSVFFPDKSSLNLPQAALGCVTVNSACSAAQYSVFLPDKSSLHLPQAAFGCVTVNSACCAAHGKRMQEPRWQVRFGFWALKKQVCWPAFFMAPQTGLEPVTPRLTAACSTDWAIRAKGYSIKFSRVLFPQKHSRSARCRSHYSLFLHLSASLHPPPAAFRRFARLSY